MLYDKDYVRIRHDRWRKRTDKGFADVLCNLTFNGLYARKVLSPKVRELCAIAGLTAVNALPQLAIHIRTAFRAGATRAEVREAIIQMMPYCGVPYVSQGIGQYEEVVKELKAERRQKTA